MFKIVASLNHSKQEPHETITCHSNCWQPKVRGGGDSTLIRRVCATRVLNLSPCSGVGKPKNDTLLWSHHFFCIVLYCIVLYCIVLYCIVLYCIVLYCIVLYCIVLYCIVLYCIVLYWRQRSCLCFTYLIK